MKEYKFRGKRFDNKEWVYGYYVYDEEWDRHYIFHAKEKVNDVYYGLKRVPVIPESVGQYINRKDKDDIEIYEKDIVINKYPWDKPHLIEWPSDEYTFYHRAEYFGDFPVKIIGNITDNPELLLKGE